MGSAGSACWTFLAFWCDNRLPRLGPPLHPAARGLRTCIPLDSCRTRYRGFFARWRGLIPSILGMALETISLSPLFIDTRAGQTIDKFACHMFFLSFFLVVGDGVAFWFAFPRRRIEFKGVRRCSCDELRTKSIADR